jgi:hypothetical protein
VTYEATDQYVFVVGDATRSYSPSKLREFTRAFLFVPPNCFIIGDLVRVAPNADRVRWLLHSATQPKVDGDRVEIIGDGGRLVMQTVVPFAPGRDVTVVGGPGHEFEVNGINYAPGKKYDPAEAGQWRLELAPKAPDTQYRFLNVLATSEAGSTAWPEVVHQSDPAGATLVVRLAGREVAVRLAGESPLFSHLTIRDTRTNEALCDADLGEG